jgi:hypothetical protein
VHDFAFHYFDSLVPHADFNYYLGNKEHFLVVGERSLHKRLFSLSLSFLHLMFRKPLPDEYKRFLF